LQNFLVITDYKNLNFFHKAEINKEEELIRD
jgi:hypothetical protein